MCATLVELLRWRSLHQPDQEAYQFLIDGEKEGPHLTYGQLDRQARAIGTLLQRYEAYRERVLLLYSPGIEFISAFFGCLYAGAIAVPAYPPHQKRYLSRIPAIVKDSQATFVFTTEKIRSKIETWFAQKSDQSSFYMIPTDRLEEGLEQQWQEPDINSGSLAFLQYTSGSTTEPKGVMVSHGNLLDNLAAIQKNFEHTSGSRGVSWLPLFHDMGLIGGILQPLFGGFPVVLMSPEAFTQHPIRWLQAISKYRATTSGGPNFGYELCVNRITTKQHEALDLSSWELAFNGSETVHYETLENFAKAFAPCSFRREAFYPCYGLAEATLFVSGGQKAALPVIRTFQKKALEHNRVVEALENTEETRTLVGCGQTQLDQTLVIVHPESLTRCQPDQIGEIWIAGSSVTQGYWKRPEESESTFWAYLKDTGEGPFLRTGDLGFIKDGELFITGRLKDLIIIRGCNHYPEDIEWWVEYCHPLVKAGGSTVFTVQAAGEERLVVAAEVAIQRWDRRRRTQKTSYKGVEHRRPEHLQPEIPRLQYVEEAIANIRQVVSEHHELQVYAVLLLKAGTLPKTSSGKVQRHTCKARYLEGNLEVLASSVLGMFEIPRDTEDVPEWELLLAAPPEEQQRRLEAYLRKLVAAVLNVDPVQIDRQQHLVSLGLGSVMAMELQHRFESRLGLNWPMAKILGDTSIVDLSREGLKLLSNVPVAPQPRITATHLRGKSPLSYNQRALWFLYRLDPHSVAYNVLFAMHIRSEVDVPALRRAFQRLLDRHDALRTTYLEYDGEPLQQVHEHLPLPFEALDASTWSWDDIHQKLDEIAHRPFDLDHDPVLRITVLTRSEKESILLLTIHHIAVDFWSLLVMMDELRVLYPVEKNRVLAHLPLHTLSYEDFVRWQAEMLKSPEAERLFAYWQQQLSGELPALNLPTDRPRPPVQTYQGVSHSFKLSTELTQQLRELAQTANATLYMTLLAAFFVLLYRYTGQEDILVGSPAAGRKFADFDEIVGYLVNPVVIRANLSGNPTFLGLLRQIRQTVLAALEHQHYPFQLLVERLKVPRDASRSPIFQVMFVMQEPHRLKAAAPFALREAGGRLNLGGLEVESLAVEQRIAQFDLTLVMVETADGLMASLEYNTDLFDAATIRRMVGHFQTLLEGIVECPEQHISELPILTEAERHQILVEWNDTKTDYPKDKCIHELFEAQVERTPNAVAVVFEDQQLTYCELNARANQLAHYLQSLGVGPEVLVGICVERSLEMIVGLLGILKAGGAYVPLDPEYPKERLAFMMEDTGMPILLAQKKIAAELPEHQARVICLDTDWGITSQESKENLISGVQPNNVAYVIYTSGSTGKPKGVIIEHGNVLGLLYGFEYIAPTSELQIGTSVCSFGFDVSVWEFFSNICFGGTLHFLVPEIFADIECFASYLVNHRITSTYIPPALLLHVIDRFEKLSNPISLTRILVGVEPIKQGLLQRFRNLSEQIRIINGYGPTETTICATFFNFRHVTDWEQHTPIGMAVLGYEVYLVDPYLQPVPVGVVGELCISGIGLARGYFKRPELTAEKFIPNPFSNEPGSRLYKTGDLARYLPEGNIEFLGRLDHQVKIRGFRIELGEIEAALTEHSAVQEAVVIVREDQPGDKRLVAYVVLKLEPGNRPFDGVYPERSRRSRTIQVSSFEFREYLKNKLPDYMIPSVFVFLDALPLTPNGKVDRRALPAPKGLRPELEAAYAMPETEAERIITELWQEVLQVKKVGVHDNFFELGGHSLLAVQIHSKLQKIFGQEVSLVNLFTYPTVHSLAQYISRKSGVQPASQSAPNQSENRRILKDSQNWRRQLRQKHRSLEYPHG